MAEISPFGALRFTRKAGSMEELACPPYDIISEEERLEYLKRNPHNIIRLELPREGQDPYRTAGETLEEWLWEDILAKDEPEGFYIYEEQFTMGGKENRIKGLICRVRLEPFSTGVVLPHEETLSKAKEDRFNLMCATGCNFSSVYSLYFDGENQVYPHLDRLSAGEPEEEFTTADGILHRVWRVTGAGDIDLVRRGMAEKKLYIADGHHRYETALRYREHLGEQGILTDDSHPGNYIMMTLVHMEHPGLVVQPTHRLVHSLSAFDPEALLEACGIYFDVTECPVDRMEEELAGYTCGDRKALAFYHGGKARILVLRDAGVMAGFLPDCSAACQGLDVNILHTLILERLLGIDRENMANQKNLTYTRSTADALKAVDSGAADCAFLLNATRVDEIAAVAGAGEKMPQKSTYFYPKLITGHVMNPITK